MSSTSPFPSLRSSEPLSDHRFRTMIWKTYEENGLATLQWKTKKYKTKYTRGTSKTFTVISSPFKGCPTKTFRHFHTVYISN